MQCEQERLKCEETSRDAELTILKHEEELGDIRLQRLEASQRLEDAEESNDTQKIAILNAEIQNLTFEEHAHEEKITELTQAATSADVNRETLEAQECKILYDMQCQADVKRQRMQEHAIKSENQILDLKLELQELLQKHTSKNSDNNHAAVIDVQAEVASVQSECEFLEKDLQQTKHAMSIASQKVEIAKAKFEQLQVHSIDRLDKKESLIGKAIQNTSKVLVTAKGQIGLAKTKLEKLTSNNSASSATTDSKSDLLMMKALQKEIKNLELQERHLHEQKASEEKKIDAVLNKKRAKVSEHKTFEKELNLWSQVAECETKRQESSQTAIQADVKLQKVDKQLESTRKKIAIMEQNLHIAERARDSKSISTSKKNLEILIKQEQGQETEKVQLEAVRDKAEKECENMEVEEQKLLKKISVNAEENEIKNVQKLHKTEDKIVEYKEKAKKIEQRIADLDSGDEKAAKALKMQLAGTNFTQQILQKEKERQIFFVATSEKCWTTIILCSFLLIVCHFKILFI